MDPRKTLEEVNKHYEKSNEFLRKTVDLQEKLISNLEKTVLLQSKLFNDVLIKLMDKLSLSEEGVMDYLDLSESEREVYQDIIEDLEDPSALDD